MTESEARQRVLDHVNAALGAFGDEAVIVGTLPKSYGWVLFYQSRRHVETGNPSHMLAGNGPIIVLSRDGSLHPLLTAFPVDEEIARFERTSGLL